MGLFDKKECALCGGKVNMLTQKKISDGVLCSDCKHKLGCFTSGWKERSLEQVKQHLDLREQNKQKYAQFNCSASAGSRLDQLNVDFNHNWFIIAGDNKDYKAGNPQVFDFAQLQDFWIEEGFTTEADSDHDGIPDRYDNFDNRQAQSRNGFGGMMNNMMNMNAMNNSLANVPLAAQPFIRRNNTSYSSGIQRVSSMKVALKVTDPYILKEITFYIDSSISANNQAELMQAYDTAVQVMQLCQQMKGIAPQMMNGMGMNQSYGQPMNNMGMNRGFGQPMNNMGMNQGFGQPMNNMGMNQGYGQPMNNMGINQGFGAAPQQPMQAGGFCPNCGAPLNGSAFCSNCGTRLS